MGYTIHLRICICRITIERNHGITIGSFGSDRKNVTQKVRKLSKLSPFLLRHSVSMMMRKTKGCP